MNTLNMKADNATESDIGHEPVSSAQYNLISACSSSLFVVMSISGIMSNIMNITTFIVMGINDGVTVSFLALSIFDLLYLISCLCNGISNFCFIADKSFERLFLIDPFATSFYLANILIVFNLTNVLTTTFVAVTRCIGIVKPLLYRNHFTRGLATVAMAGFMLFSVALYTPLWATTRMVSVRNNHTNMTRLKLWLSKDRESIKDVVFMLIHIIFPFFSEVIILVCVLVMSRTLLALSRFRQGSTQVKASSMQNDCFQSPSLQVNKETAVNTSTSDSNKLTGKDLRVVQQIVLISVVYIACNAPRMMVTSAALLVPEFTIGTRYTNLYLSVVNQLLYFGIFNASINTFIYYKYNRKFQATLLLLFGRQH